MPAVAESSFQLKWYCNTGVCPRGAQMRTRWGRDFDSVKRPLSIG
jgi:hypothetical protein